jgi:hypothetical protein
VKRTDAAARVYAARFVQAGRTRGAAGGPGALFLEPEALRQACLAGLFDGRAVFLDHAAPGEHPSLRDLVGVTGAAAWNAAQQAVDGELRLYATPDAQAAASLLDAVLADSEAAPQVGLSLVFWPVYAADPPPGGEAQAEHALERVSGIRYIESIDLVFEPAAGGRLLRLPLSRRSCAARASRAGALLSTLAQPGLFFQKGVPQPMDLMPVLPDPAADCPPAPAPLPPPAFDVPSILAASGLPAPARSRLAAASYPTRADLDSAIDAERAYLASLAEDQVIRLAGPAPRSPQITGMRSSTDQIQLALEALLSGVSPAGGVMPLSGIRELYHLLSGDYEMTGLFRPERVYLANVTSSTMAGLVANAFNKTVVQEFQTYPQWWTPIVSQYDFGSLQQVKWITLGGVGELPTVAEGAAYTELTWDDNTETSTFVKKGGYLGVTMEAIDKDDVGRLRAAPRALAQAAWLTLSKAISTIFTTASGTGPTLADGIVLFHSSHGNVNTTALSITAFNAVRTAMRKQTELNSGERLGALTAPAFLLVPPDLEITALQVLASEFDYTYATSNTNTSPVNINAAPGDLAARMAAARSRVIVVDLWTDTTDWAAVANPSLYPTIGLGFRYGRQPEIFSVASPTSGLMFTNDTLPIKVRFVFATGPMDYRGMYKMNV